MKTHSKNYYNPEFTAKLISRVALCLEQKQDKIVEQEICQYGILDDFLYAEHLSECFSDMHQDERYAAMQIIRKVINYSVEAYAKAIDGGYSEQYGNPSGVQDISLDEFIDKIKIEEHYLDF
ncbi:hypothetical protein [Thalassotalea sp. ND16A]|uniref:hypothetical protein n=1 Tax=Thalassotalea sp. ND16A TaxID=1535422 RepID=UPI00051A616B|nr:hypothetical protein [Thalassotalea sp. ND16A]KGJ90756.1 hypothetical protein ND16A_1837 [Thalassotalea sp. ND16A]